MWVRKSKKHKWHELGELQRVSKRLYCYSICGCLFGRIESYFDGTGSFKHITDYDCQDSPIRRTRPTKDICKRCN